MNRDEVRIPLHRFTVKQLHRMRETGIVAPRARLELLAGILVDMPRPTARELEATRRIAAALAETFDAEIVAGEPAHPDGYATFDAMIMVHDWEQLPVTAPYRLHRFSIREFDRMVEIGILADTRRHELLDGVVLDLEVDIGERAAAVAVEVAGRLPLQLPVELEDVVLAIDVAVPPDDTERLRWPLYARWGITTAWIVDLDRDEIRTRRRTPLGAGFVVERQRTAELLVAK